VRKNVCTNGLLTVVFDSQMDGSSFANNFLLIEEVQGGCPSGNHI